jgi:hypothetical protein
MKKTIGFTADELDFLIASLWERKADWNEENSSLQGREQLYKLLDRLEAHRLALGRKIGLKKFAAWKRNKNR